MTEPTKRGRPRKEAVANVVAETADPVPIQTESAPVPPGPFSLVVRYGQPGAEKTIFSQRVYAHTIDQQAHQAVITGALHPLKTSTDV